MIPTDDPLVVARTPLRLSLGGGGTDLPFYADRFGGDVLSATISLHVTVVARHGRIDGRYRFSHEALSAADRPSEFQEPYLRAAAELVESRLPYEISSMGPVPSGTGLGSSGAFAVSLLGALTVLGGRTVDRADLVEQACRLEMAHLGRPVGKHDQYVCGLGGLRRLRISTGGKVESVPTSVTGGTLAALGERLMLLYTGTRRDADASLAVPAADPAALVARTGQLHRIRDIGAELLAALESGDLGPVPALMRRHAEVKSAGRTGAPWDDLLRTVLRHGAEAGKLVGAGGGGFLLLYLEPERRQAVARAAAALHGASEIPFEFVPYGTTITRVNPSSTEVLL